MIVWLSSYPRSGNTFFRVLLNSTFGIQTYSVYDDRYDIGADEETSRVVGHIFLPEDKESGQNDINKPSGWSMPSATLQNMREDKKLYIVKTHELLDEHIRKEDKVIYLLRDGRESTLSFWKYSTDFIASKRTLRDFIGSGGWGEHAASWDPAHRDNTLLVQFETLIDNPEKMIGEISRFINVQPTGGKIPTFGELQKVNPKFFRSGKKNSWKEIFSEDDHKLFWQKNGKEMIKYGYTDSLPDYYIIHEGKLLPKVTVVTVSYNTVEEIEKTIQSVIEQNYANLEYIIIDGASTDGTVDIIKKYEEKIDYWVSEADNGMYYAMNKAINIAKGEWINFMNAGDTFVDETTVEKFVDNCNPRTDICYGSRYVHKKNHTYLDPIGEIEAFYFKMPFGHQAAFSKSILLKKFRFDTSLKLSADYDFFIQCYRDHSTFQNLNFPVCHFYAGGMSYQNQFKSLLETLKLLSDYVDEATIKKSLFFKESMKKIILDSSSEFKELENEIEIKNSKITEKENMLDKKNSECIEKQRIIDELLSSKKYKLGSVLAAPYIKIKEIIKKKNT